MESKVKISVVVIGSIVVDTDALKKKDALKIFQVTDRKSCEEIVQKISSDDMVFIISDGREVYYAEKFFSRLDALKIYLVTEAQAADNKNLSDAIIQLPAKNFSYAVYEVVCVFNDLFNVKGLVAVNFADVKSWLKNSGKAVSVIGEGANVEDAVADALNSHDVKSARAILMNVKAATDSVSMPEVQSATEKVQAAANEDAKILWSVTIDDSAGDKVKAAIVAFKLGK